MAIELITCAACSTKNASHRTVCLRCGENLLAYQKFQNGGSEEGAPINEVDPKTIYKGLTFFVMLSMLVTAISTGGWLAGFMVPADRLTAHDYEEAVKMGRLAVAFAKKHSGEIDAQQWYRLGFDAQIELRRWETKRRVQSTAAMFFWPSRVLTVLFHWMRREPYSFDSYLSGLPKVISGRIPYFIARWRVSILDENGNELATEFHRTGAKATKARARLAQGNRQVKGIWDISGKDSYWRFIESR